METVYRSIKGKILPYLRDRTLLFYDQAIESHSFCSEILRFCLFAFILPFFVDCFFDSIFRVYVFPSFFLCFLAIYYWNSQNNIEEVANKGFRSVKFLGDDRNRPATIVGENCQQTRSIIVLFCIDVVCGLSLIDYDPFLFIVSILFLFYYGRIKSRDNNLNLIIFLRLVSFRAFIESPVYLRLLLAYSPIFTAHLLYDGNCGKFNNRGSIIRRHLLTYESHHSNSSPFPGRSTPTKIIESLAFTSSNNAIFSVNNDRASSLKKRASSYSNTASTTNDEEREDLLLAGEKARARTPAEAGYSLLASATGCEYFIDTINSNASASSASSAGAFDPHKTSPSTDVLRRKIHNVFCPSSSNAAAAVASRHYQSSQNIDNSVNNCDSRPMPRSSHSYGGEMQNKSAPLSLVQKNRRTSLPAGPLAPAKISNNLSEARGLISELLLNKDLPNNVVSCLKAVNALLNPNQIPVLTSSWKDLEADIAGISETPFIGAQFLNPDSFINVRRSSVITWSTVTSAAGLPHIEAQPSRSRSIGSRKDDGFCEFKLASFDKEFSVEDEHEIKTSDGISINVQQLAADPMLLECCSQWDFEIFDYYVDNPDTILSRISYRAFDSVNLFSTFSIDKAKFFNFFHHLECGYRDLPYHNRIHASDVVHSVIYFTQNPVPSLPEALNGLSDIFSSLELLALYTASAMHDYDHPGLTNAFLVSTSDPKMASKMDWQDETDRLLLAQMFIKMGDINSPTKSFALHKQWTERILEEFYAQGDEEKRLGLPVSIYMDRKDATQVAKLQDSFLAHLVKPLTHALHNAGMLPLSQSSAGPEPSASVVEQTIDVGNEEDDVDEESFDAGDRPSTATPAPATISKNSPTKKTIYKYDCDLICNIDSNHEYWKSQMPKGTYNDAVRKVSRCTTDSGGHESEMETINEDEDEAEE